MVSVFISQCRIIINIVLLFEFLRISGESRIVSDLSLQHRNVIRQPVTMDNNQIVQQRNRFINKNNIINISDTLNDTNEYINNVTICECVIKEDDVIRKINKISEDRDQEDVNVDYDYNDDDDQIKTNNLPKCLRCTNASMFY